MDTIYFFPIGFFKDFSVPPVISPLEIVFISPVEICYLLLPEFCPDRPFVGICGAPSSLHTFVTFLTGSKSPPSHSNAYTH